MLGVMWTMPDTFAAVNAKFIDDMCFSVSDADGLCRTSFQASDTSGTFVTVQIKLSWC